MTEKQETFISAFLSLKRSLDDVLDITDQEAFTSFMCSKVIGAYHNLQKLEERGSEQWEYQYGFTRKEFEEILSHLKVA